MKIAASIFRRAGSGAVLSQLALPLAGLLLVILMVLPIPGWALDIFFAFNLGLALSVLMITLLAAKPLDFSAFPTVLLFATLMRLSLNVASTRVVLVHGHEGVDVAGHFIAAFGHFLIADDYIVGLIIFVILMVINLVVIAKGAGRVSEVSARFTLDALPGKQMAIDADLNAGLLTPDEARSRRAQVAEEADFYGAMDGASKFVKGDAVAGIFILLINMLGGLLLGTLSHGLAIDQAAQNYMLLAIGDGLVAQIPALLLSIASAIIVTRVSSEMDLSGQLGQQFLLPGAWLPVATILGLLALVPGMPMLALGGMSALSFWLSRKSSAKTQAENADIAKTSTTPSAEDQSQIYWQDVIEDSNIAIDIGYALVPLVDQRRSAPLLARITAVRRQLSTQLGFVVSPVRISDDLAMGAYHYRISISGVILGEDSVYPDQRLALHSAMVMQPLAAQPVKDPSFGMDAYWIDADKEEDALAAGYTVVDSATVIATHLHQILLKNSHMILGQEDVQEMLNALNLIAPAMIANLVPKAMSLPLLTRVLQLLLQESVPIRDFRTIAEALSLHAEAVQDAELLVEKVRAHLGAAIIQQLCKWNESLKVVVFSPELEDMLLRASRSDGQTMFEPALVEKILKSVGDILGDEKLSGTPLALITAPSIRRHIAKMLRPQFGAIPVLGFHELPESKNVEMVAIIGASSESQPL